jgi:outer membrane protein assembly factor BamB
MYASSYTGPRSTPTYDNGRVYFLSERGRLGVFDAKTGKEIWAKDLARDFDAPETLYGYSESVYIDGNKLYVKPYGRKGYQACLNKNDGSLVWANTDIPGDAGYCSPVVFDFGGYRHVVGSSASCYYGVDAATGRLLWKVDYQTIHEVSVTDAVVKDGYVCISGAYGKGTMVFKLVPSGNRFTAQKVWQSELMDNEVGGIILHEGYLYGTGYNSRGLFCIDFMTGKEMWNNPRTARGSITFADGMVYLIDERSGNISISKATPGSYTSGGQFRVPSGGQGPYWAHPVVCGKRLYVRHWDKVFVYDLAQ